MDVSHTLEMAIYVLKQLKNDSYWLLLATVRTLGVVKLTI